MKRIKCWLKAIAHFVRTGEWQPHEYQHTGDYYTMLDGRLTHIHIYHCVYCGYKKTTLFDVWK